VEGPDCPLCDQPWDNEQHLRDHLIAKLAKSEEARKLQEALLKNGMAIAREAVRVIGLVSPVQKIAEGQGQARFSQVLISWKTDLEGLKAKLTTVDGLACLKGRLAAGWLETPKALSKDLQSLTEKIPARRLRKKPVLRFRRGWMRRGLDLELLR
jgi:hypothetical protein